MLRSCPNGTGTFICRIRNLHISLLLYNLVSTCPWSSHNRILLFLCDSVLQPFHVLAILQSNECLWLLHPMTFPIDCLRVLGCPSAPT